MAGTKLICPHCQATLRSRKDLPVGKRITCLKCKQPFAIAPEMLAFSTGETLDGTSFTLAETQAGTMQSPLAGKVLPVPAEAAGSAASTTPASAPLEADSDGELPTPRVESRIPARRYPSAVGIGAALGIIAVLLIGAAAGLGYFLFTQHRNAEAKPSADINKDLEPIKPPSTAVGSESASAEFAPLKKVDAKQRQKIEEATLRGVLYLKQKIKPTGTWKEDTETHSVGYAALPGLALLECGVPAQDAVIQQAAAYVRTHAPRLVETYDIGTAILFLDRLGNPADKKLIRDLALRLIAGQTSAGGWSYECPLYNEDENAELTKFLLAHQPEVKLLIPLRNVIVEAKKSVAAASMTRDESKRLPDPRPQGKEPGKIADKAKTKQSDKNSAIAEKKPPLGQVALPSRLRSLPIVAQQAKKIGYQPGKADDNSNTHFALLGLWTARRHGLPVERSLSLAAERFQKTQAGDGGWGYVVQAPPKNTMTCVGLVALAMGHGSAAEIFADAVAKNQAPAGTLAKDPAIQDGLKALGLYLDGDKSLRGLEARIDLYYLWSLERVGMLYRQEKFGKRDWYAYGVKLILDRQQQDGRWQVHYDAPVDTAFALLFLKRSNLVQDLTTRLHCYLDIPNATTRDVAPAPSPKPAEKR